MSPSTSALLVQVPAQRLRRAEKVLKKLGLTPADAVNLMLAQIEICRGLPFDVSMTPKPLLSAEEQAMVWTQEFGAY